VHDLLVAAGPPPELPPALQAPPPSPRATVLSLPRRRRALAAVALAAALAAAVFGGYAIGTRGGGFTTWRGPIAMHGATSALASLRIGRADAAGNWPVQLRVSGLPKLPPGGYYELLLTRDGARGPECGTFVVDRGTTVVTMNAPSTLPEWNGWVIVRHLPGQPADSTPILST
jgi:hypothetical protein